MTDLYTCEERTEAKRELSDALTGVRWEDEMIEDGICPNCAGTGYQDAKTKYGVMKKKTILKETNVTVGAYTVVMKVR